MEYRRKATTSDDFSDGLAPSGIMPNGDLLTARKSVTQSKHTLWGFVHDAELYGGKRYVADRITKCKAFTGERIRRMSTKILDLMPDLQLRLYLRLKTENSNRKRRFSVFFMRRFPHKSISFRKHSQPIIVSPSIRLRTTQKTKEL